MSRTIKQNISYLRLLPNTRRSQRKALVKTVTLEQLRAIGEIALNILHGVIPLSSSQKKGLSRYRSVIRLIGQKNVSRRRKKVALLKNTKALELLLKAVEPLLKSL